MERFKLKTQRRNIRSDREKFTGVAVEFYLHVEKNLHQNTSLIEQRYHTEMIGSEYFPNMYIIELKWSN